MCGFISCVVLLWFDVCWSYGVVRLDWCGILMQAEALFTAEHVQYIYGHNIPRKFAHFKIFRTILRQVSKAPQTTGEHSVHFQK